MAKGIALISYCMPLPWAGAGSRPGSRGPFLCNSPKKRAAKKGDPAIRVPSLRCGQPAGSLPTGKRSNSPLARLKQSRFLIRWQLRSSARLEGCGSPTEYWGCFQRQGPCRSHHKEAISPLVAAPAAHRARAGPVPQDTGLRKLARRGCSSAAPSARSEFRGAARNRSVAGCPKR